MRRIFRNLIASSSSTRTSTIRRQNKPNRFRLNVLRMEDRITPALILVTSLVDSAVPGSGSFRDAVAIANSGVGAGVGNDTIQFDVSGTTFLGALGPILVTEDAVTAGSTVTITRNATLAGLPVIVDGAGNAGFSIIGLDAGYTGLTFAISGNNAVDNIRLTNGSTTGDGGALNLDSLAAKTTLTHVTITGCSATGLAGGGVASNGELEVVNSTITGNKVVAAANVYGGGIFGSAKITVTDSNISGNTADAGVAPFGYGGNISGIGDLTVTGSTINNGVTDADGSGGGISITGGTSVFVMTNTTVTGSQSGPGAGVYIVGGASVTITGCTISNNASSNAGAMMFITTTSVTVTNTVMNNNNSLVGGAFYIAGAPTGTIDFNGCTFNNNISGNIGGVVGSNGGTAALTFTDCTFKANSAVGGGVFYSFGASNLPLTFIRCTAENNVATAGNTGGVLNLTGNYGATLTVRDSTFSGNTAAAGSGGAISVAAAAGFTPIVLIENSTISGNSSTGFGGGVRFSGTGGFGGTATIRNSTIVNNTANNTAGGISMSASATGTLTIISSIIAQNRSTAAKVLNNTNSDLLSTTATATSIDFTFLGVLPNVGAGNFPPTEAVPANNFKGAPAPGSPLLPGLLPLNFYGGTTKTMVPDSADPNAIAFVINKGSNPAPVLGDDQRGPGFIRMHGGLADIGAAESFNPLPSVVAVVANNINTATPSPHTFTISFTDNSTSINLLSLQTVGAVTVSGGAYGAGTNATWVMTDVTNPAIPVATYSIPDPNAPAGFDLGDNGVYSINVIVNKIFDNDPAIPGPGPNAVSPNTYGSFVVGFPQTFVVNARDGMVGVVADETTNTDGKTSLREAIQNSNASPGNDAIIFDETPGGAFDPAGGPYTITLTKGQLDVTATVNIDGPTAVTTVDANLLSRVMTISGPGAMVVGISDLVLTKGLKVGAFAGFDGGGILTTEELTLTNVTVSGNKTDTPGGGISVNGSVNLTLNNATISGNSAGNAINFSGGGISFAGNGTLSINDSDITGNVSQGGGAGIITYGAPTVNIANSTISGNSSTTEVGGAMYVFPGAALSIVRSTISGNSAPVAGGGIAIFNPTALTITNSTVSGNTTLGEGGGLYTNGLAVAALIQNSTFTLNEATGALLGGGGIAMNANVAPGALTLQSTIVSENIDNGVTAVPDVASTIAGTVVAGNDNLIGTPLADADVTYAGTMKIGLADLDPLALNGAPAGSPFTHALKVTSIAKNNGNNVALLATDQRGGTFGRVEFGAADIGAFEAQAPPTFTSIKVNGGGAQRSNVFSIVIAFSEAVTFTGAVVNAFTLTRANAPLSQTEQPGVNGLVNIAATPATGPTGSVTLTFLTSGANPVNGVANLGGASFTGNSLPDGTYNLFIDASLISGDGGAFDGNADFTGGDNFTQVGSTNIPTFPVITDPYGLFRLFGDLTGDGSVAVSDFNPFKGAFSNGPNAAFDYDNDGDVAIIDFNEFKKRNGSSLP